MNAPSKNQMPSLSIRKHTIAFFSLLLLYIFLYMPLLVMVIFSFNNSRFSPTWKGFTFKWYQLLLENSNILEASLNSLIIALASSTLATLLGSISAYALYQHKHNGKSDTKTKNTILSLMFIVMVSPDIALALALFIFFNLIHINLGFTSLLLSHITFSLPYVITLVYARLKDFNKHIIDAAFDLGATPFQTFTKIIWPLIAPAIISSWFLALTISIDDVIVSFFVTGPDFEILPIKIYSLLKLGINPQINALMTIIFAITLLSSIIYYRFTKEQD
ncbi:MAG: ABC transporter permease subunit [Oligoflexia bacterium]|nr:ABC transporter permease subunit [Oligoflexia bacterium]